MNSTSSAPSPATARKDRELAFRGDLLLDAAERVFVERGFSGASVEEIARNAGVALATLYKAFPGKDALFARVVERMMERFQERIRARTERGEPLERLETLVHETFEYFADHGDAFRMYLAATHGFPWNIRSGLGEASFERYQRFVEIVEQLCRAAAPRGRRSQTRVRALAITGTLNAVLGEWITRQGRRASASRVAAETWAALRPLVTAN